MHLVGCFVSFSFSLHAGAVLVVSLLFRCSRERSLSKKEAHGGPGTCNPRTSGTCSAKSMKVPREPILIAEK